MGIVNFYNKEKHLLMQFKDFQFNRDEVLQIVTFAGIVDFDFFHLETNFEAEEYDFRNLLLSLEKMHKREQKYVTFNPLSGKIIIKLTAEMGQIDVKVEIHNTLSTCKLEFKYSIDQSFIPELVKEIDAVMKYNKIITVY
jgi:hypothetical protein